MVTRESLISEAVPHLRRAGIESARLEAELLLCFVLAIHRTQLKAHPEVAVEPRATEAFSKLVARRLYREPLPYLTGSQPFMDFDLRVSPAVLIPRPETEVLVEEVVRRLADLPDGERKWVVDVGTGSGAIAIAIARLQPNVVVFASDLSSEALNIARINTEFLGVSDRVLLLHGDLLSPLDEAWLGRVDAVVSNPPYIPSGDVASLQPEVSRYEPAMALDGGPDGLAIVRRLVTDALKWIRPGGMLAFEAAFGQARQALDIMAEAGYTGGASIPDLAGIERVIVGYAPQ